MYHRAMGNMMTDNQHPAPHPAGVPLLHNAQHYADAGIGSIMGHMNSLNLAGANLGPPGGFVGSPTYVLSSDGQVYLTSVPAGQQPIGMMDQYGPTPIFPPSQAQFGQPMMPYPSMMPYTPARTSAQNRSDRGHGEVPGLDNGRRGSYSTNESTPATPFYNGVANRENGHRVAIVGLDRSTYTTPSPQQASMSLNGDSGFAKSISSAMDASITRLLEQSPVIPKAVPAVFTPANQIKTLEQSLENRIPGNRNVYIRGLHPTTDDNLLLQYASRFGEVETSKAIIDTTTGACKGFGFAKFYDVCDSEKCIRGFHRLGYEVGFARESFNSRLKAEGDDTSANLYISNLPKSYSETELSTIFNGYTILSSKILRDSMGNSRGVGFARFESRDICDEVIKQFNGYSIVDKDRSQIVMNIRYADTPAQKELKRITAERRQFRTNEYNIGAYGTPHVGLPAHAYGVPSYRRTNTSIPHGRGTGYNGSHGSMKTERLSSEITSTRPSETTGTMTTPPSVVEEDISAEGHKRGSTSMPVSPVKEETSL